jgi:predicted transcriptional regulator YdeE
MRCLRIARMCRSETCGAAFPWLKQSRYQNAAASKDVPNFFERYSEEFDPKTGMSGIEVWVPVANRHLLRAASDSEAR